MRVFTLVLVALCVFICTSSGVVIPEKWADLTCKVITDSIQGTGFVLRYEEKIFIITNRHLVEAGKTSFTIVPKFISKDNTDSNSNDSGRIIPSANMYFWDDRYDLAFVHISKYASMLDIMVIPESMIGGDTAIVIGQEVSFLGYPAGLHGKDAGTPLVRGGIIAGETEHVIILDGNIFGGSSGSPVFLSPSLAGNHLNASLLIGVISQMATTPTKSHPNVEENMGIGVAVKVRYVKETIRKWLDNK